MKLTSLKLTTAFAALTFANAALAGSTAMVEPQAESVMPPVSSGAFGYVGANAIYGSAYNTSDSSSPYDGVSYEVNGAYAFTLGNGASIVIDATAQITGYATNITGNEDSLPQYQASANYLHPLGNGLILNAFAGYGIAPFQDTNERYQVGFVGGGAFYKTSDILAVYGQLGYGTSFDEAAMNSGGFYNGVFVRAGMQYSGLSNTILRGEAEYAATEVYEDSNEPGVMWAVGVSGETAIGASGNIAVTYGVRYASFDALIDSDDIAETTLSLGAKYMFGGGSSQKFADIGYVGTPYLPLRASFWTPEMN